VVEKESKGDSDTVIEDGDTFLVGTHKKAGGCAENAIKGSP